MVDGWERRDEIKESEREGKHDERGGSEQRQECERDCHTLMQYDDTCMLSSLKMDMLDILMYWIGI